MSKETGFNLYGSVFDAESLEKFSPTSRSPLYDFCKKIIELTPRKISADLHRQTTEHIESADPNIKARGTKALLHQNMKTIIGVVDSYFIEGIDNVEELDELTATAIVGVLEKAEELSRVKQITAFIHGVSKKAIAQYISTRDNIPAVFVRNAKYRLIVEIINSAIGNNKRRLKADEINSLADELVMETGESKRQLMEYIAYKNSINIEELPQSAVNEGDVTWKSVQKRAKQQAVKDLLACLPFRDRRILIFYLGLEDGREKTFEEAAKEFNLSKAGAVHVCKRSLSKLIGPASKIEVFSGTENEQD